MDNYIYHAGIKGMKWGVRRYQNKDGTLTPAGKKRYADDSSPDTPKKSKYRTKLENSYMEKGLTRENAIKAADNKIKTQKVLGVVAGVTIAAATAYVVHRNIKERADGLIKEGGVLKRIEGQKNTSLFGGKNKQLHDAFYVTDNDYDHKNYKDALGFQRKHYYGKAYQLDIHAKGDIKIASQKRARDTLKKLMQDKDFYGLTDKTDFTSDLRGKHKIPKSVIDRVAKGKWVPESTMRRIYDNYNSNLVGKPNNWWTDKTRNMFYNTLKGQGYGGIQDINDLKWSKLRGKNPLILFDKSKVAVKKIKDITDEVSRADYDASYKRMGAMVGKQAVVSSLPKIATASVAALGLTFLPESRRDTNARLVKQYKKEHPNTRLTDREIAQLYKKQ